MKFVISSTLFSQRLQTLGRVIGTKNSMPILGNFLLQVNDNKLTITASDSEITLYTTVELNESEGNMDFTINAKLLQDAIKQIDEQPIEIWVNPETLEVSVKYQNGQFHLAAQSAAEYPYWKELDGDIATIDMKAQQLYTSMGRVLYAVSEEQLRPVMGGIFFDYKEDGLVLVATDGRKMSCNRIINLTTTTPTSFILHKRPAHLLHTILQKEEGEVNIQFNKRNAKIESENYKMTCRLIEGVFPAYNSVIPQDNPYKVVVNRQSFISALRRVQIFADAVKLNIDKGRITLSSRDLDYSQSGEESILSDYNGTPISIGFKGSMLLDLISNIDSEEIELHLADAGRAGLLVPTQQPENEHILMLFVPIALND